MFFISNFNPFAKNRSPGLVIFLGILNIPPTCFIMIYLGNDLCSVKSLVKRETTTRGNEAYIHHQYWATVLVGDFETKWFGFKSAWLDLIAHRA